MASQTDLRVRISADLADIKQGLGLLRGELAKVKQQANSAVGGSGAALGNGIKNAHRELKAFAATYLSLQGVKLLAGIADEATQLRGRIREAKGDYQAILTLADETRTSLSGTADLYARLERSTKGRVRGQQDLLAITKSVNQAVKLSYGGIAGGEAAVLQLGQALSSGKLAGDEFKSIGENAPRLMKAIADGMGVPIEKMKELAKEGKITTNEIVKALLSQGKVLEAEYARVPITIGDALTKIRNSFVDYIGNADKASGTSKTLAAAMGVLAQNLGLLIDVVVKLASVYAAHFVLLRAAPAIYGAAASALAAYKAQVIATSLALELGIARAVSFASVMRASAGITISAFAGWQLGSILREQFEQVELFGIAMASGLHVIAVQIAGYFADAGKRIKLVMGDALNGVIGIAARMNNAIVGVMSKLPGPVGAAYAKVGVASQRFLNGLRVDTRALATDVAAANGRVARSVAQVRAGYSSLADSASARRRASGDKSVSGDASGVIDTDDTEKKAGKAKKAIRGIIDENALLQDALKRTLDELDARFARGEIGIATYYTAKRDLLLQTIDARIAEAQAEAKAATSTEQQTKALTEVVKLQRERAAIGPAVARDQAQAEKELTDQLELLRAKLADLNGGFGNEAAAKAQDEYEALLKKLGDSAEGADLAGKIFNIESAKARIDAIQAKAQEVIANLRSGTDYINSQAQLGALGPGEADRQLFDLRARSIDQLRVYKQAALDALAAQSVGTPQHTAALAGLATINTALADAEAAQNKFKNSVADIAAASLGGFFNDLIDGAKSFKQAFTDMVRSFLSGVAKMIAQELALRAVKAAFAAFGGGSANGNVFDGGGKTAFAKGAAFALPGLMAFANGGAFTNQVFSNPTMFRFGQGGQFGVMGEAGPEAVMPLTRGADGKLGVAASGGGAGIVTTPIVAIGDDAIANALAGAAGERVVLTHVRANWEGLQRG